MSLEATVVDLKFQKTDKIYLQANALSLNQNLENGLCKNILMCEKNTLNMKDLEGMDSFRFWSIIMLISNPEEFGRTFEEGLVLTYLETRHNFSSRSVENLNKDTNFKKFPMRGFFRQSNEKR